MDWNDYHRLDRIHDFLEELNYDFPSICTVGVIGTSLEGRQLKVPIYVGFYSFVFSLY